MKYIERLQASDEELNQSQAEGRAAEAQADLESRISSQQARIVRLSNQVDSTLNQYPLNLDIVIEAQSKVASAEKTLEDLKAIHEDLFGTSG